MAGPVNQIDGTPSRDAFFSRVVHQHARLLYRVAYSVLRNPADAEDAVADTVLKLLRTGAWQTATNERGLLIQSVWRTALDRFAARRPGQDPEQELLQFEDHRPTPEQAAARAETHARLHALIDRLPPELREALLLSAVNELNSREISEALNLPEGTVRTRLMRARQQLRAQYEDLQSSSRGREVAARGSTR